MVSEFLKLYFLFDFETDQMKFKIGGGKRKRELPKEEENHILATSKTMTATEESLI